MGVRWETFCSSIYWYQCGARLSPFSVLILRKIQALFGVLTSPNHRNLRRGKPQILSLNGSKPKVPHWYVVWLGTATTSKSLFRVINLHLPLFLGVLGGEASQGMPITYKYIHIYIHTHIYKHIYIYMYLNICYTVNIHIYIIHIADRRAT